MKKQAEDEQADRKREEELLMFKTPSQNFLNADNAAATARMRNGVIDVCTCIPPTQSRNRLASLPTVFIARSPVHIENKQKRSLAINQPDNTGVSTIM